MFFRPRETNELMDRQAMTDLACNVATYAEYALGAPVDYDDIDRTRILNPLDANDRRLLISLADTSLRALNTAMIENPSVLSLLGSNDPEIVDGITNSLVFEPTTNPKLQGSTLTPYDLNRYVEQAFRFIDRSKKRHNNNPKEFDDLSAVDLYKIIFGSMECLHETANIDGCIRLYSGAEEKINSTIESYQKTKEIYASIRR